MGLTAVEILVVDERGHVAALVHDAQDDCLAIRRIKPLIEDHVTLAIDGSHPRNKETPVPTLVGIPGDPLESGDQLAVIDEPLIPTPGLDGVGTDIFKVGSGPTGKSNSHAGQRSNASGSKAWASNSAKSPFSAREAASSRSALRE